MGTIRPHTFHIPVMGLCYTIDSPQKVARFGISSVISIIEDQLIEDIREYYSHKEDEKFVPIPVTEPDSRAKRITAYMNLINRIVARQMERLKTESFSPETDLTKYFEMLPNGSSLRNEYELMLKESDPSKKQILQNQLKTKLVAGSIDVNIMSKVDKNNYSETGDMLPPEFSDALSALRGFANSDLNASVVFSAGYNPRLYAAIENHPDFFPDENGNLKKRVILKVSDYRSALIQGKILAKKGVWISEFRIESGLNCGGHAFATEGLLLGPILEEFKTKKDDIIKELYALCQQTLAEKGKPVLSDSPEMWITVQGGIGTAAENQFLMDYYHLDGTGWGSPFLLVPEATTVDPDTLNELANAKQEDFYLSHASPLGIRFNNFRRSSAHAQMQNRIEKDRPGSPCYLKFLSTNTEFTEKPICTGSRQYQKAKLEQLEEAGASVKEMEKVVEKDCLCHGLSVSALLNYHLPIPHKLGAVTICPGPNLAYFSGIHSLKEMVDHIYGRISLLNSLRRPNLFVNEAVLYVDYLKGELAESLGEMTKKKSQYLESFKTNLQSGLDYYGRLIPELKLESELYLAQMREDISRLEKALKAILIPEPVAV